MRLSMFLCVLILSCPSLGQDVQWDADDGHPADNGWSVLPGDDPGVFEYIDGCLPESVWRISDWNPVFGEKIAGWGRPVELAPEDSAVYEIVLSPDHGFWKFGLTDSERDLTVTMLHHGGLVEVGFWWPECAQTLESVDFTVLCYQFNLNSTGDLFSMRVEKYGDELVRVLVDDLEILEVPYDELPLLGNCDGSPPAPWEWWHMPEQTAVLSRGNVVAINNPEGSVWMRSYRHHIGSTSFPEEEDPILEFLDQILEVTDRSSG